jgi:hypothetical protein
MVSKSLLQQCDPAVTSVHTAATRVEAGQCPCPQERRPAGQSPWSSIGKGLGRQATGVKKTILRRLEEKQPLVRTSLDMATRQVRRIAERFKSLLSGRSWNGHRTVIPRLYQSLSAPR